MLFQNLRVLELASVLAGPSVGQFFAELGAEVIKVENANSGGDVTRTWKGHNEETDDRSAYFCSVNWGKKSIAIDLGTNEGKRIVHSIAAKSDIVIASYKPGDAEKLGVSYSQMRSINHHIIYGQVTGYGSDSDRVGYDAVIQAESGFMDLNGERNGQPMKMPVALIDILAAHQLKEGLLVALLNRERTREGSFVEVSLIQAALSSLANQATNWLVAHTLPVRQGSLHPNIAPYGESFITKDGRRILFAIGNDRQFADLVEILNLSALASDTRFSSNKNRVLHRQELSSYLCDSIIQHHSESLIEKIHSKKIPAGIIQNVKEVFESDVAKQVLIKGSELSGVKNFVANISGSVTHATPLSPPPHFGEHTSEILTAFMN